MDIKTAAQKILAPLRERRMPWRLVIATCFFRGLVRNPLLALRMAPQISVKMQSLYRFNLPIHGKDFMKDFYEECGKLGLRPFLFWGTLLGCVREGGFIRHDYDIDFGMLADDYSKKDELISAMLKRGYRLRLDLPHLFSFNRPDGLLHLDINLVYSFKGRMICSEISGETNEVSANEFPAEAFGEPKKVLFLKDLPVWVPGNAEAVLRAIYGDWRVPVKDYDYKSGPRNQITDPKELLEIKNK